MTGEERMEPGNQVNFGSWMRKGYRSVTVQGENLTWAHPLGPADLRLILYPRLLILS